MYLCFRNKVLQPSSLPKCSAEVLQIRLSLAFASLGARLWLGECFFIRQSWRGAPAASVTCCCLELKPTVGIQQPQQTCSTAALCQSQSWRSVAGDQHADRTLAHPGWLDG